MRCQASAYLALESLFADYSLPVAKEYGLLMLDKSYGTEDAMKYQEYFLDYMSYNTTPNKDLIVRGADFYQVQAETVSLESEKLITEQGGRALEEEILAYMEFAAPVGLAEWILEKLGLLEQAEIVTDIFEKLSDLQTEASKVDTAIQKMHRGMNQIKGYTLDVYGAADSIRSALRELEELEEELAAMYACQPVDEDEEDELARAIDRLEQEIRMVKQSIALQVQGLVQGHAQLLEYNQYVEVQRQSYDTNTQIVGQKLAVMEELFENGKEKLDEEMRLSVETELFSIRTYSAGVGDYYEVVDGTQDIRPNIGILAGNIELLSPYMSGEPYGLDGVLSACESAYAGYKTENMQLNYVDEAADGNGTDVMKLVRQLLGGGLLGLVMKNPSELSLLEFLPDKRYEDSLVSDPFEEEAFIEQIMINEYLLDRMGNLHETREKRLLSYELEYILAGKETDRENLEAVAAELLELRAGMNFIYLLGCEEKRAAAETLATLLVGFTGMYGIIKVTQLLILLVWAEAEALVDVRELCSGGRVPFVKDDLSWQLDFASLCKLGKDRLEGQTENLTGLDYKDYLRLLLLKKQRIVRNGRAMDLIEGFVKEHYDTGFSLGECVTELVVQTEFYADPMFIRLPFVENGRKMGKYYIKGISNYGY